MFSLQVSEKQQLVENFDRFSSLKHSPVEPKAFTEKGLYMLATILKVRELPQLLLPLSNHSLS